MFELFQMWALVEVLGIVCLPLTMTVCHNLPDRGWAFSKALGMALLAFAVWLPLMCVQILPFSRLFILGMLLLIVAGNVVGGWRMRQTLVKIWRSQLLYIVAVELIFLGMVFLLGWLRSYKPDIYSYEMYMDEGFIAAIMRSPHLPPNDMWYAGASLNYYYYAHFTIVVLAKLLGQSPSIAFNTGICIFYGLTAANLFGVTCNIVGWARHVRTKSGIEAYDQLERPDTLFSSLLPTAPYGLLSVIMALILGNLAATQQWWQNHGNTVAFDWFGPSRVIVNIINGKAVVDTINEFPAFSFLLSCFHAHVLGLAFTILAIGLAFNLLLEPDGKGLNIFGRGWQIPITLIMTALILGGLFTMNGWDFPTYVGLAIVCIVVQQWLAYHAHLEWGLVIDSAVAIVSLVVLSFLLYLPFYLNFVSPSQGIGLVPAEYRSSLHDEVLVYGLFAFVFLSLLLASAARRPLFAWKVIRGDDQEGIRDSVLWQRIGIGVTILIFLLACASLVLLKNGVTFVVATMVVLVGVLLLFYHVGDRAHAFVLILGCTAFLLIAGCEIFFLRDVFADGTYLRMNTVFKFYFQAWALLSIASGAGLYFILDAFRELRVTELMRVGVVRGMQAFWSICFILLILAGAVYPILAPSARLARVNPLTQALYWTRTNSLDGLTYLQTDPANPGDYAAIRWLNANVQGDPVIVEGIGDDYTNVSRISAFTGLPTIMGWIGHEYQWRVKWLDNQQHAADFNRRGSDIEQIYTNPSNTQVLQLMKHYNAQYLYVGALEMAKYGVHSNLRRFASFMHVAYQNPNVTIYKVN
jgi:YYY domain-containing protein